MSELSELLFSQGAAMNQAAASGIAAGEAKSQRRIEMLTNALQAIAITARTIADLDTCGEKDVLLGIERIARDALHD